MLSARKICLLMLGLCILSGCATTGAKLSDIASADLTQTSVVYGAQLYTVRKEMAADFDGTIRHIADMGYDEVEFAGLFGENPERVRVFLDQLGLKVAASHIDWKLLRDDPDTLIAETKALGAPVMILAWIPPDERHTLAQWENWITIINSVAAKAQAQNIGFAYHNHDFEFQAINGVEPYDLLMKKLDRKYVKFELDLYWLALAGCEPEPYFDLYPRGFPLAHIKDMSRTSTEMVDVGDGRIDFPAIFAQAQSAGLTHLIVEHDTSEDPFRTLERSLIYLKSINAKKIIKTGIKP